MKAPSPGKASAPDAITSHWYRESWVTGALSPLSALFSAVVSARRFLFETSVLTTHRLPVPVIVIGNISVGGTGKTPLVAWLAHRLSERGLTVGLITRGYGGSRTDVCEVLPGGNPAELGDEAVLLARRSGCPVWRGADRVAAGLALLAAHPGTDCILSDDGLQHYRMGRDVEVAVIDGARGFGNGMLLPAGPLREPLQRLDRVDAIVINGESVLRLPEGFAMHLAGNRLVNMRHSHRVRPLTEVAGRECHAVAGIGNPSRFFAALRAQGLKPVEHPFADHHRYRAEDLEFGDDRPVVMTEKDAVKCFAFARDHWWYLPVSAQVDPALVDRILSRLPQLAARTTGTPRPARNARPGSHPG